MAQINTRLFIEKYLKILDKNSKITDFKLNEPQIRLYNVIQEQYRLGKPIRIIILKARQMGFSTLVEGIGCTLTVTTPNYKFGIITHTDDATNNLYNMSRRFYNYLPEPLKPTEKANNAKNLIFDTKDGTGLGSSINCMTAGAKAVGRSATFNFLHISEYAFWEEKTKQDTLLGLLQAVPNTPDSVVIIESTANGYEDFKARWDRAVSSQDNDKAIGEYIPVFFAWFELADYTMPYNGFRLTNFEDVTYGNEIEIMKKYGLTLDQMTWRRWCILANCGGSLTKFKQEYPMNPFEAFVSTGRNVFDKEIIEKRLYALRAYKPIKVGHFEFDMSNDFKIDNIKWVDSSTGYIKIFEEPITKHPYVIAGDPAGDGADFFTAQVINNITKNQVAMFKNCMDEDLYAQQLYCLGWYYNFAMIGIETNFTIYSTKLLEIYDYPTLYIRQTEDTFSSQFKNSHGFKTTMKTRPLVLNNLKKMVRECIDCIVCREIGRAHV